MGLIWHSQIHVFTASRELIYAIRMQWIWSLNVWPLDKVDYLQSQRSFWTGAIINRTTSDAQKALNNPGQSWVFMHDVEISWGVLQDLFCPSRFLKGTFFTPPFLWCDLLRQRCFSEDLSQTGGLGGDNMTAMLILLKPNEESPMSDMSFSHDGHELIQDIPEKCYFWQNSLLCTCVPTRPQSL